jgi:hypothetical protein
MAKKKAVKKVAKKPAKKKATTPTFKAIMDTFLEHRDTEKAKALITLRRLCEGLTAATGVKKITYEYSGEGDSGSMNNVDFYPFPSVQIPEALKNELEKCAWEFIPSGFENNDGGSGVLTIDIPTHKMYLEHSERVVETNDTEEEFEF